MRLLKVHKQRIKAKLIEELTKDIDLKKLEDKEKELAFKVIESIECFTKIKEQFGNNFGLLFDKGNIIKFKLNNETVTFNLGEFYHLPNCLKNSYFKEGNNLYSIGSKPLKEEIKNYRKQAKEQREKRKKLKCTIDKVINQYCSDTTLKKEWPEWSKIIDEAIGSNMELDTKEIELLKKKEK